MIHLDSSFLIRGLVARSPQDGLLRRWLANRSRLAISSIAWTEFCCGPVEEREAELASEIVGEARPFTSADAEMAARLFNVSGRRRGSLADCMIAAAAIGAGADLATANPGDFERFESAGLRMIAV